jgi:hypothetical protein
VVGTGKSPNDVHPPLSPSAPSIIILTYIAEKRARLRRLSTESGFIAKYPYVGIAFDIPINARPVKPVGPTAMNIPGRIVPASKPYCSNHWT